MTSANELSADEEFMTPAEARKRVGVTRRTFQRYVADGRITAAHYTPAGHARFARADVEAMVSGASRGRVRPATRASA